MLASERGARNSKHSFNYIFSRVTGRRHRIVVPPLIHHRRDAGRTSGGDARVAEQRAGRLGAASPRRRAARVARVARRFALAVRPGADRRQQRQRRRAAGGERAEGRGAARYPPSGACSERGARGPAGGDLQTAAASAGGMARHAQTAAASAGGMARRARRRGRRDGGIAAKEE
eukprot:gene7955-biopygen7980